MKRMVMRGSPALLMVSVSPTEPYWDGTFHNAQSAPRRTRLGRKPKVQREAPALGRGYAEN
jgi:hypothetical protein